MGQQTMGWIKIHRRITEWEWYQDKNTLLVFLHLLLVANYSPKKWMGTIIEKGETTRSLPTLAQEMQMSIQEIRTTIKKLKSTGEITERKHGKFRLLKIKKYEKYQSEYSSSTGTSTVNQQENQQTSNSQSTVNKNVKNVKNERIKRESVSKTKLPTPLGIEEKTKMFIESVKDLFSGMTITREQGVEIQKFVEYWTEPNKTKTKIRWEMEKTWDLKRRIARWMRNDKVFEGKKVINKIVRL